MFYRIATEEDFKNEEIKYGEMSDDLKLLIEKTGNLPNAKKIMREHYGYSAKAAKELCEGYNSLLRAKSDFEKGRVIYTEY